MALISMQNETFFDQLSNTAVWSELQSQRLENGFMWTCVFKIRVRPWPRLNWVVDWVLLSERGSPKENHRAPIEIENSSLVTTLFIIYTAAKSCSIEFTNLLDDSRLFLKSLHLITHSNWDEKAKKKTQNWGCFGLFLVRIRLCLLLLAISHYLSCWCPEFSSLL